MIKISKNQNIYSIIKQHPNVCNIMVELGFTDIVKKGMLQTVGRVMTIEKGAKMKEIDLKHIEKVFKAYGFIIT